MLLNCDVIGAWLRVMLYRVLIIFIFFFSFTKSVFSEDYVDSLETKLILVDNAQKLLILDKLIPYYFRNEPLQANKKADKMLSYALMENNKEFQIRAKRYKAISNSNLTSYHDIALIECEQLEIKAKTNGFVNELILIKLAFADIYHQVGEYTKSLEYQLEAIHLADSANVDHLLSITLNNIAISYIELEEFERAEQSLRRSLKIAKLHDQVDIIAETNVIYGDMYSRIHNYEYALEHYKAAYEIYLGLRKDLEIAIALFKISKSYFYLNELDESFQHHLNALSIRNRINDRTGLAESYNEIGFLCIEIGEFQRGINNLKLGLNNAEAINSNTLMQQSFDYLNQGYLQLEDYENANIYQRKYIAISDLIYTEQNQQKVKEIENIKEIENRDSQIRNLEKLKNKTEQQLATSRWFVFTLALLLVVIIFSTAFFIKSNREKREINKKLQQKNDQVTSQNDMLVELNGTKDKFFSIIGHDLKGPLNSLSSFSSLLINHTSSLTEEEIRTVAKDLDKSLKNLYELLENLLGWAQSQTGRIKFDPEDFKITDVISENIRLLSKAALNKKISLELIADEEVIVNADINSVKTIIRNLLSNAIKFTPEGGIISIFVDEWKDFVEIGIRDTGVGISEDDQKKIFDISAKYSTLGTNQEKGTGLGLILCKEFIMRNHGSINVESQEEAGTTIKFTLPKYKVKRVEELQHHQV